MNKKTAFLAVAAVLLMSVSLFLRLEPRTQRLYRPYLLRGACVSGLALAAAGGLLGYSRLKRRRARAARQRAIDRSVAEGETWLLLRPKEARPVEVGKIRLWQRLAYAHPANEHFSFEAYGNSEAQGLALHASPHKARAVLGEFFQEWPDLQRRPAGEADPARVPQGWHACWVEVGPASADRPIAVSSLDPLLGLLSEIANVPAPTRILVQVIARLDSAARGRLGRMSERMRASEAESTGQRYQQAKQARILEERGAHVFLQAVIRLAAMSPSPADAQRAAAALANTVCGQFGPDNPVVVLARSAARDAMNLADRPITGAAVRSWADGEIAALAHLPGGDALKFAPLLSSGSAKSLPAGPDLRIPQAARLARYEIHPPV